MPHALLLSPDDQAVSAITGVLQEMSVDCERPLDGSTAAQKLHSQSFDLVLVDCDNLPAAKLIFDVCRRSNAGNCVPIAIVDGRAGLPTAFRLGAELILTKPVSKDQARNTIRTAVSRTRNVEPVKVIKNLDMAGFEVTPAPAIPAPTVPALAVPAKAIESPAAKLPEARAFAAAAPASSPKQAPSLSPAPATLHPEAPKSQPAEDAATVSRQQTPETVAPAPTKSPEAPAPASAASKVQLKPSDDPVMAELDDPQADQHSPVFAAYEQSQRAPRGGGLKIAVFCLLLAGGGFYAAWMYQPQFRQIAQAQIDKGMALAGLSNRTGTASSPHEAAPAKPPVQPPVSTSAANPAPTSASQPAETGTSPNTGNQSTDAPAANASAPVSSTAAGTTAPGPASTPPAAASSAPTDVPRTAAAAAQNIELPGAESAIILSSKGAEKRLIHRIQPVYPAEARALGAEGTVVLKTLVGADGAVKTARSVEGDATLAAAASKAVKQWRYRPYVRDGKTMPFQTIVIVDFQRP